MNNFYVVNIWWDSMKKKGGYKVLACTKSLHDAAVVAKQLRTSWCCPVVRDGTTGHRYVFADLVDSWTKEVKV